MRGARAGSSAKPGPVRHVRRWSLAMALAAAIAGAPASARAAPASFGVAGGVVGARLHGDYGDIFGDLRAGGAFGAHARFALRPGLSFQPELWWILKGGQGDLTITGTSQVLSAHVAHSTQYLELPLLLRMSLPAAGSFEPFIVVGPTLAARTGGDLDFEPDPLGVASSIPSRMQRARIFEEVGTFDNPDYRDWDWGMVGGVGVAVGRDHARVNIEVRYERGFVDILASDSIDGATNGALAGIVGIEVR